MSVSERCAARIGARGIGGAHRPCSSPTSDSQSEFGLPWRTDCTLPGRSLPKFRPRSRLWKPPSLGQRLREEALRSAGSVARRRQRHRAGGLERRMRSLRQSTRRCLFGVTRCGGHHALRGQVFDPRCRTALDSTQVALDQLVCPSRPRVSTKERRPDPRLGAQSPTQCASAPQTGTRIRPRCSSGKNHAAGGGQTDLSGADGRLGCRLPAGRSTPPAWRHDRRPSPRLRMPRAAGETLSPKSDRSSDPDHGDQRGTDAR